MTRSRQLRRELRQRRRDSRSRRIAAAESLASALLALPFACRPPGFVAGYWAMDGEIALHVWQMRLPPRCTYCLPVLDDDRAALCALAARRCAGHQPLRHSRTRRRRIRLRSMPQAMSLVVLPLVGFDANGQRLGMGGGWYDRSFAFRNQRPAPPWLVGAGFAAQQVDAIAAEPWDVRAGCGLHRARTTLLLNPCPGMSRTQAATG